MAGTAGGVPNQGSCVPSKMSKIISFQRILRLNLTGNPWLGMSLKRSSISRPGASMVALRRGGKLIANDVDQANSSDSRTLTELQAIEYARSDLMYTKIG